MDASRACRTAELIETATGRPRSRPSGAWRPGPTAPSTPASSPPVCSVARMAAGPGRTSRPHRSLDAPHLATRRRRADPSYDRPPSVGPRSDVGRHLRGRRLRDTRRRRELEPRNKGVRADFVPGPAPETGQCVHKFAMAAVNQRPCTSRTIAASTARQTAAPPDRSRPTASQVNSASRWWRTLESPTRSGSSP